jgi:hypothetical protein
VDVSGGFHEDRGARGPEVDRAGTRSRTGAATQKARLCGERKKR